MHAETLSGNALRILCYPGGRQSLAEEDGYHAASTVVSVNIIESSKVDRTFQLPPGGGRKPVYPTRRVQSLDVGCPRKTV